MDAGSILLGAALLVVVGTFVISPFLGARSRRTRRAAGQAEPVAMQDLAEAQEAVVAAIRDLDFDYGLGKIPEDDYRAQRAEWSARGVEILKQIDSERPSQGEVDQSLEAEIQARREQRQREAARKGRSRGTASARVAAQRSVQVKAEVLTCSACGKPLGPGDAFCPKCGARVPAPARPGR